ncbi:MAG: lipase secretion chaperone [Wenzhouxiangellaceae bacterium]
MTRRRLFGAAAAERLATLDAQRADWNSRLSRFAQARRQVLNQGGPDAAAALGALLEQSFDPAEQRRVLALLDAGLLPTDDGDG